MQQNGTSPAKMLWNPAESLPPRIKRLREEFYSFYERDYFRNEVMAFTTGKPWDSVYSPHNWGVVPEVFLFFECYSQSLLADAAVVELPPSFWKEPLPKRRALFFRKVVESHLPVRILQGELVVGGQFNTALSRSLTKREAAAWKRMESGYVKLLKAADESGIGNGGATPGHLIPDYRTVLEIGFKGLVKRFNELLSTATNKKARAALEAMIISAEAPCILANRYSEELGKRAADETDPLRKRELERMATICSRVPWEPAQNYWEALQSLWFTHMLVMAAESYPGAGLSYGRFDQLLYPYYKKDIDADSLTPDFAKELLMCFFIKHNYAYDFQGRVGTNQGINSGFGQLITLSGMGKNGEDLTNDFTYLCLEVIQELNMLEPKPNVRLHRGSPHRLLARVSDIIAHAQGAPFLLNFDEQSIRALRWIGLPEEELWDYAPVGCLENTLQGNDRSGTVDVNINLAKAVELVLFNGRDQQTRLQKGPKSGDPRSFETFDDFMSAYRRQTDYCMKTLIELYNISDEIRARFEPTPYLSTLVRGCAEKGKDITEGGAHYNFITMEGVALGTTIDSLLAIKKLVYEDGRVSMDELAGAIDVNFEGREPLRQLLVNRAPKFGNDDQYADSLAREVSNYWTMEVTKYRSPYTGRRYRAGYLSWNYWISYAPKTSATPDGRKRGSYLSNGLCPVNGADRHGPTAMIKSVGNLGLDTVPNGGSHTFSLSPSLVRDREHIDKLAALLRSYTEHGGTALQINIIDADTLRAAQKNPDEYRNLLVRITGYNAYFVMIGKEIQDEIIARESHRI
ncbi:MAG: hypothetical protein A2W19_06810 [Spirochaetes bacterium RBG_16_49_21]|nr:MAG: hypothetical protein A2W19_06810 [Spirochaetes bacterium RBG_16_49_21]